jgi:RNA processing factor Prp31
MEQLKQKKEELQQKKILIDGELELIEERILELQNINESKVVEQESEYSKMAYAVDEFMRCSSKIMYHGQNQLCGYLAGICGKSVDDVKKFYNECMIEPSREMIEAFLKE